MAPRETAGNRARRKVSRRSEGSDLSIVKASVREDIPFPTPKTFGVQDSAGLGWRPLLTVIRKTSPTPVQMALSATLKAGKPISFPPRCWR